MKARKVKNLFVRLLAVLIVLNTCLCSVDLSAFASAETPVKTYADYYYGSTLEDPIAQKFYNILLAMDFTTGESVEITDPDIIECAKGYAIGDMSLLEKFGAARDCFYYDRTDLFYVDFFNLSLNVSLSNGKFKVEIGRGRTDTYFTEGITAENVHDYIDAYNAELDTFVDKVKESFTVTEDQANTFTWSYWNAYFANKSVDKRITYGFCKDENGDDTINSAYIRTAYGALMNRQSVCEGYTNGYTAVRTVTVD